MMEGFKALMDVLATGGPMAVASVFAFFWFLERRDNRKLQKSTLDLAVAQVQANVKLESTLSALKDLVTQTLNRY